MSGYQFTTEEWAALDAHAGLRADEAAKLARNRAWNMRSELIGLVGEVVFARVAGLPEPDLSPGRVHGDGGRDFGDVDVKATPHYHSPRLLRLATDPFKAGYFALVAVDLMGRRARYVGWATREQLRAAPVEEYGYGPTHTLYAHELRPGLPPVEALV